MASDEGGEAGLGTNVPNLGSEASIGANDPNRLPDEGDSLGEMLSGSGDDEASSIHSIDTGTKNVLEAELV